MADVWDEAEQVEREHSGLPQFATEEEKQGLVGTEILITAIRPSMGQFGEVWYVDAQTKFGERTISISAGIEARDAVLAFLADKVPVPALFSQRGPAYWFERPAAQAEPPGTEKRKRAPRKK